MITAASMNVYKELECLSVRLMLELWQHDWNTYQSRGIVCFVQQGSTQHNTARYTTQEYINTHNK